MLDRERQLHFFVLNQRWKQAPGAPLREGGGEPGKLPKEMKKEKGPFQKKGDCCQKGTLKNFSKNKKAYCNRGKTPRFRVLSIRQ